MYILLQYKKSMFLTNIICLNIIQRDSYVSRKVSHTVIGEANHIILWIFVLCINYYGNYII